MSGRPRCCSVSNTIGLSWQLFSQLNKLIEHVEPAAAPYVRAGISFVNY